MDNTQDNPLRDNPMAGAWTIRPLGAGATHTIVEGLACANITGLSARPCRLIETVR